MKKIRNITSGLLVIIGTAACTNILSNADRGKVVEHWDLVSKMP